MSEKVKALEMAFDAVTRKREGKEPPVATCPSCSEPLIMTLKFRGKEFICVACRRLWGFVEPTPAESTPELLARLEELRAQWRAEQSSEVIDAPKK
jgi:hypothetical protein